MVSHWSDGLVQVPPRDVSLEMWWNSSLLGTRKEDRRRKSAILLYTVWNLWKERNRSAFDGVSALPSRIFFLIKEELQLREAACRLGRRHSI
jgi:hypothetical protein